MFFYFVDSFSINYTDSVLNWKHVESYFLEEGFIEVSQADLSRAISFDVYKAQIASENTGGMAFLKKHLNQKKPPHKTHKTAFVALFPYFPYEDELKSHLKVAYYAKTQDYHKSLEMKLDSIVSKLKKTYPKETFDFAVDSKPYLERDLAYKAGLGWVGKNTCLINKKKGSLFYICEVLTSLPMSLKPTLQTDHCGTCTKCIEVCPTQALRPRHMDVDKCISFRTIEDKDTSLKSLTKKTASWFFGCDLCQSVCPWNEKAHTKAALNEQNQSFKVTNESLNEIKEILKSSNKELMRKYKDFALNRARGNGLKRNALKLIYENKITELKDFLKSLELSEALQELKNEVLTHLDQKT